MRTVLLALGATTLIQAMAAMSQASVPVLATEIAAALDIRAGLVGYYTSVANLGAMLLQFFAGALVVRFGGIRIGQLGLCLCAAGLLMPLPAAMPMLVLSALAVGIGYGPGTPAGSHILARVSPPHLRNLIFSVKQAGVPLGGVLAGLVLAPVAAHWGWQWALGLAAGLCLAVVAAVQPAAAQLDIDRRPNHPVAVRAARDAMLFALLQPQLRAICATAFVYAGAQLSLWSFLVVLLVERVGLTLVQAGFAFSCMHVAGVLGRVFWGWVADRLLAARLVVAGIGLVSAGLFCLVPAFGPDWPYAGLVAVCVALGLTASGWNGVFLAEVARLSPEGKVSQATGGVIFFTYGGVFVGPMLFGTVATLAGGYAVPFLGLAALVLAAALFALKALREAA